MAEFDIEELKSILSDPAAYIGEGSPHKIEKAIDLFELVEEFQGDDERDRLVVVLFDLFESGRSRYHLDCALKLAKELYDLGVTTGHDNRQVQRASNYAKALGHRYWEDGNPEDLHKAIELSSEAVNASPQARSILDRPRDILHNPSVEIHALNTLAARLEERFQMAGSLKDLNDSIDIREKLIAAVPWEEAWQASRAEWLLNLAASLQRRYEQDEGDSPGDIDRAVELSEEALRYASENSLSRSPALCTLANALGGRAGVTQQVNDLDRAIQSLREAQRAPANHASPLEIGVDLAMRLFQRSEMTDSETTTDLDEATYVARSTLAGIPERHPTHAHLQNFLGLFLYARFCLSASKSVADEALDHFRHALGSPHYPSVFHRVQAGRLMLRICCDMARWQEAYEVSLKAIKLIPRLSSRAIRISDKQRLLSADDVVGFGADAAAAALQSGKDGYAALRLLEMGRQSLAASVAELRPDLVALRRDYPELADRIDELRDELQNDSPRQHAASGEFDILLKEIREKEGFQRFLDLPSDEEIREAAAQGHLIVLTVSMYRGVDAILIGSDKVHVLNLNEVTLEDLEKCPRNLQRPDVLSWLWDSIAKPILNELGLTRPSPDGCLPRIWWIPTGILTRFPFHAAGHHSEGSADSVIDLAVSSYSSSVKVLVDGRRRTSSLVRPKESKALLVAITDAPERSILRGAAEEAQKVEALFASKDFDKVRLGDSRVYKQDVLQHLETYQIFHFAGHGVENISDPLRSSLLLHDWKTDPLTVGDVLEVNLSEGNPFLAYLSACETGQVSMPKFRDESVHLVGAYQLAGFRHVIGTLWGVADDDSVTVATATYENMLEDMTDDSVCRSLHKAALGLRNATRSSNVGADQTSARKCVFVRPSTDKSGADRASWVPFVHFGV
ncbi:CHAT domain-containing protein [Fusarium sp. LHS14.1]|nr:CHAT domain-containing protein [Fusarium sp. LHS14.1]